MAKRLWNSLPGKARRWHFLTYKMRQGYNSRRGSARASDFEPHFLVCDLTDIHAIQDCTQNVITKFGTVDVLVNNAANDARHSVEDVTPEYWDQAMAVNLRHQFFVSQA